MSEMVIPGTYIDVRAEGLISAGGVATGVVGVVGTASAGPIGVPVTLSGFADASGLFGAPDRFAAPADGSHPLTLTRALQWVYGNGASTVVAVRVASPRAATARFALKDSADNTVATLVAATPGTWANDIQVSVDAARAPARIVGERQTSGFGELPRSKPRKAAPRRCKRAAATSSPICSATTAPRSARCRRPGPARPGTFCA